MARIQGGKDLNVMYVIGVSRTETLRYRSMCRHSDEQGRRRQWTIGREGVAAVARKQNVEPEILAPIA